MRDKRKTKSNELYSIIHKEILDARINIEKLLKEENNPNEFYKKLFNILSDLNSNCPQKAYDFSKRINQ